MAIEVTSRSLFKGRPDKSALYKEIQPNPSVARSKSISRFQSARVVTRLMRRNFSSRAPELSGGQAFIFSHDCFEHRTKGDLWDRIRGKYLVPKKELRRAKIVLLARDPRDCFVSLYVQMTRRDRGAPTEFKRKTVGDLLRDKKFGVRAIIKTMNAWLNEFSDRDDFTIIRYESLREFPRENFRTLLVVLGEATPDISI